jgi:hypothetical protein
MEPFALPIHQLEGLRFKANHISESITSLMHQISPVPPDHPHFHLTPLPPWPELLSKYNVLVSQAHSFSMSLEAMQSKLMKTPTRPDVLVDMQPFREFVEPMINPQPAPSVFTREEETVRRLAERMRTKGAIATASVRVYSFLRFDPQAYDSFSCLGYRDPSRD